MKEEMKVLDFRAVFVPNFLWEDWEQEMQEKGFDGLGSFFVSQMMDVLKSAEIRYLSKVDSAQSELLRLKQMEQKLKETRLWVIDQNPALKSKEWICDNAIELTELLWPTIPSTNSQTM